VSSVASSLRSYRPGDRAAVVDLSRHALQRPQEQVGNPLWVSVDELDSELGDWASPPEETLFVEDQDGDVIGFGGVEVAPGWKHADLFGPLVAAGYRGRKIGTALLDASVGRAEDRGAGAVLASVGARNLTGRILLEGAGFHQWGSANAVFRLQQADHRPIDEAPAAVTVRRGEPDDLAAALRLYGESFPEGVFPEGAWLQSLRVGTVYLAETLAGPVALVNIDQSDRWIYHLGVAEAERSRGIGGWLLSSALSDYWERHPRETLGLSVRADNVPALRLYRRQGFAPWLVLQSFELEL
jgi:ribosomal protein S18 acetylase RimI-like enzyme